MTSAAATGGIAFPLDDILGSWQYGEKHSRAGGRTGGWQSDPGAGAVSIVLCPERGSNRFRDLWGGVGHPTPTRTLVISRQHLTVTLFRPAIYALDLGSTPRPCDLTVMFVPALSPPCRALRSDHPFCRGQTVLKRLSGRCGDDGRRSFASQ
jgi:hypothetical protein